MTNNGVFTELGELIFQLQGNEAAVDPKNGWLATANVASVCALFISSILPYILFYVNSKCTAGSFSPVGVQYSQ